MLRRVIQQILAMLDFGALEKHRSRCQLREHFVGLGDALSADNQLAGASIRQRADQEKQDKTEAKRRRYGGMKTSPSLLQQGHHRRPLV
jgi:hypothetical protein